MMAPRTQIIDGLRKRLDRAAAAAGPPPVLPLGVDEIDATLADHGLRLGALHEVAGAAATGFALALMGLAGGERLWCGGTHGNGFLYPPGLGRFGVSTTGFTLARPARRQDALWVAEEALRCGACACVVLEADFPVSLTESRRLQLAAEEGGGLGVVLRPQGLAATGAAGVARTRWHAAPCPGPAGAECWHLELTRNRGGALGAWPVAWADGAFRLHAVPETPERIAVA